MKSIVRSENVICYIGEYFLLHIVIYFTIISSNIYGRIPRIREFSTEYSIDENCRIGTEIGTISTITIPNSVSSSMTHSSSNEFEQIIALNYKLGSPSTLFSVDERKGLLTTKAAIDAEALCAYATFINPDQSNDGDASDFVLEAGKSKNSRNKTTPIVDQIKCNSSGDLIVQFDVNAVQADGSLRAVHHVIVRIHDLNDNGPKFDQIRWHKRLKEVLYRAGRRIDLPKARDIDILPEHSRINYRLESWQDEGPSSFVPFKSPFKLDISSSGQLGLILTEDLDAETETRHRFVLVAYSPNVIELKNTLNGQLTARESRLEIDIEVADMNDNEPRFSFTVYNISVPENTSAGTVIYELVAHDRDSTSKLTYTMASSLEYQIMSSTFHIESDGHVRLRSSLDYELRHIYSIPVEVTDGEFSARNTLNVQVLDVNDEPPAFELNPKQLVAEENAPAGKLIGRVRIRDPDSPSVNGLVRCSEPPGLVRRQALHFLPDPTVNPTAEVYDLTTRIVLDREDPENPIPGHLIIYLICSDGASGAGGVASDNFDDRVRLTSTMTTTLIIRDVNDHKPIFEKSVYHVSIQENNPIGEKVVQIKAEDLDEGENARITYSLLDRANFKVDSLTGWITPNVIFDRETRDSYQVTAIALDHGKPRLSSSVLINITVLDVNDHSPILASYEADESLLKTNDLPMGRFGSKNLFIIRENMPVNTYIGNILASDKDEGLNAELRFMLLPDPVYHWHERFKLSTNGSLYTNVELDREEKDHYRLTIIVSDKSPDESLKTTGTIAIIVLDVNDNQPKFVRPQGLLVPNNTQLSEYKRHMNRGVVLYDQPSEDHNYNAAKNNQKYSDQEYQSHTSSESILHPETNVQYTVPDPVVRLSVYEKPDLVISKLYAEDPDAGENGAVFYLIEEFYDLSVDKIKPNPLIRVQSETGDLILLRHMAPIDLGFHFFKVTASDRGHPQMKIDQKILPLLVEDKPASGGLGQSSLSSSYYMSNISGLGLDGWGPGSEKNILIITILSVVSGILVAILISAVFCVTKPCSSNRHGNRCVNGRHDRLRNRPPTYPGGPDSNNGILMNENGAFINGTVEQRGYPLSNGSQPTTFNRPPGPLNGDLYMDNWIHHVRDSEASYGNMTFPLSCPSGDSEQDISNDQHILINPRFKSQKENHFNYVNGQPSQVIYENLERCHLHDTDLSSDLTTTRMSFSSRNNDHPVAIRVLSPQIGVDGVSGVHDQIFLPRSNKLSGISIGHSIDSIIPTSNSALPPLSMKMDTANAFCVSKPIPVLSKTIYSFSEYQMDCQLTENSVALHEIDQMNSTQPTINLPDTISEENLLKHQSGRLITTVPKLGSFYNCMTANHRSNLGVEQVASFEEHASDSGRGGSEEELNVQKCDSYKTQTIIPNMNCEEGN
ncbi:Protocadherin gamma-A1 [Schistosoma japonicum]|uniref:Protocadherin gamma-A1 n=1 Tax=Schistosoma japonicum TaxID=6182 RepID=A0A4Z2DTF6_SCHJA|nr:Protocadherin gamma-A1 [Schistosoma japonicum]